MDDCLEWFELSEEAILIGTKYSRVVIFSYYVEGMFEVCNSLCEIISFWGHVSLLVWLWPVLSC